MIDSAGSQASWLALMPVTGRTHQLRAHCAAIGTPILGDAKYGEVAAHLAGVPGSRRLHLHARSLSMPHPLGGTLAVTAQLPLHMRRTWEFFGFPGDIEDPFAELELADMKRFYRNAEPVQRASGHGIALDGKPVKHAGKRDLIVPNEALATAIAEEWNTQEAEVRPATMPLTRLADDDRRSGRDATRERSSADRQLCRDRPRLLSGGAPAGAGRPPAGGLATADRLGGAAL